MLASGQENMTHENKTDSKVNSHTVSDHNARMQIGINMQFWATMPFKERSTQEQSKEWSPWGSLNRFYWYQIFTLVSNVAKIQND